MGLEGYECKANNSFLDYVFYSEGPKGKIKKGVRFKPIPTENTFDKYSNYFNLSFGDWNEERKDIDDTAVSNNNDRDKILITVSHTVFEFLKCFPQAYLYAEGSTPARTRLYQIGINRYWDEVNELLDIYGYTKSTGWQLFRKGVNYESFIACLKNK